MRSTTCFLACVVALGAGLPADAQVVVKPLTPAQRVPPPILVARIDANCAVFHNAIRTESPIELAAVGTTRFTRVDPARRAAVMAMTDHVWVVHAWKVGGNLNWVNSVRLDSRGTSHLTQLCFRNDGTLARVRQAASSDQLDASLAREAYFRTDGSVIRASAAFERDDPAIPNRLAPRPYGAAAP